MASPDEKMEQVVVEEKAVVEETEKKEPEKKEPPKELEEDAKKDKDPKIKETVTVLVPDTTMNVLPSSVGSMLMPMTEGGLSQLVAGARASVGVKSGRYMFEAKIVEQSAKAFVRVGFSAEGSLFLGEDDNSICFEFDGAMVSNRKKTRCSQAFGRDTMVAVVLNLDEKSPNANTISFFKDGHRASQPQALPEELKGKTLFPAVSYKNATVHLNFGAPVVPLPFVCKPVQEATTKDAVVTKYDEPKDGKYSVLFPLSLPDEGTFDWLDSFLEQNPSYTEISDRAFADWAAKSGFHSKGKKDSNDKPGCGGLENVAGCKKALMDLAAMQPRNFVIMEVRGNLIKADRLEALGKFKNTGVFKCVAEVIVNEPPATFKKIVHAKALAEKQRKSDAEHKRKHEEEHRKWQVAKRTKDAEKAKKKREKELKKKAEETKKKAEEAQKARMAELKKAQDEAAAKKAAAEKEAKKAAAEAAGEAAPAEEEEKKEEEPEEKKEEEEEKPEEKAESEEEPEEPEDPAPTMTDAPTVSLTAEEKAVKFFSHPVNDLTPQTFASSFTKFSLPEAGEFDNVKYSWSKEKEAAAYVKEWIFERKQTTRVEDITPSTWFKTKAGQWASTFASWKGKQNDYKAAVAKKAAEKQAKANKKAAAEKKAKQDAERAEKKAKEEAEKKAKAEEEKAKAKEEGKDVPMEEAKEEKADEKKEEEKKEEEKKEEAAPAAVEEVEEEEEPEPELDFEGVDVFGAEDILDVGNKVPLFRDFQFEDFTMLALRVELHLLVHSFSKDCDDPDRTGIHIDHLPFYYQRYYGRNLNIKSFGVETAAELVGLINDTIVVTKNVLESIISAELESNAVFAKVTEAARRERNLQVDMGDEGARLKIKTEQRPQGQKRDHEGGHKGGGGWRGDKGAWDGGQKGASKGSWDGGNKGGKDAGSKGAWGKDAGNKGGKDGSKGGWGKDSGKDGAKPAWEKPAWESANKGGKDGGKPAWESANKGGKDGGKPVWESANKGGKDGGKPAWGKDAGKDGGKDGGSKGAWGKDAGKDAGNKGGKDWGKDGGNKGGKDGSKGGWGKDSGKDGGKDGGSKGAKGWKKW